ncbi:MAG: peptidylprolyl isomerase [Halarcobacter sp.]
MFKITTKKIVTSLIASIAITTGALNAADSYGSVNGDKITQQDVNIALRNAKVDFNALPQKSKEKVLDQIVERKLLTQKAVKSGVDKGKAFKEALAKLKEDLSLEIWMQEEFKKIKVSEKEAKAYYNKNKEKFITPTMLEARHILVKTEKEAKDIIKSLDKASNKKEEFEKLAKTKSVGPTGPKGGYLGKFSEDKMVPEFSKAAKSLKVGTYTKTPVKTQFGYHVIYLDGKEPSKTLDYDKVSKNINGMLLQTKFKEKIDSELKSLRKKAKIVIK